MEECVHTKGKSCVQRLRTLQNLAACHNLPIIDNSQPSCTIAPWILVRAHEQTVRITYTWEDKIIADEFITGLVMEKLPEVPGEKPKFEIFS